MDVFQSSRPKAVAVLPGWHGVAEATPKKSCATPQATPNENMNFVVTGDTIYIE